MNTIFEIIGNLTSSTYDAINVVENIAGDQGSLTDVNQKIEQNLFTINNVWMLVCTALVFIMHLGFSMVETGFTQSKNSVNILYKNTLTPMIGILTYAVCGFALMYPSSFWGDGMFPALGTDTFNFLFQDYNAVDNTIAYAGGQYTYWTDFLFQAMFAATTATIVSGAVAERMKISSYLIFTFILVGLMYPIFGSWKWGGGFLHALGFYDFAGSTLVHSVGGWAALAGIIVLGPRLGKYVNGEVIDKPGSSVPLATMGIFLLIFGWFGFNGGSVLSADPATISLVLVNTTLGACGGGFGGVLAGYMKFKRLDFGMVLNGLLAGLVSITAGTDQISPLEAIIIGFIGGILVVYAAVLLDRFKLDDCVGAIPVHLVCGIWGTLAVGIFASGTTYVLDSGEVVTISFLHQLIGVCCYGLATFLISFGIFWTLRKLSGIRVTKQHELEGLDSHEHGIRGYTIVFDE